MKNLLLTLLAFSICTLTISQTVVVEDTAVTSDALEKVIIEKVTNGEGLTSIPNGYTVYRVFVDLTAGSRIATVLGDENQNMIISLDGGEFYNNTNGSNNGHVLNSGFFGFVPELQWDSYLSMGAAGSGRIGVPYSVNNDGYIIGDPVAEGLTISPTFPDVFGTSNSSTNVDSNNDLWGTAGLANYESQGVTENTVLVGQFTCSGDLSFKLQFVMATEGSSEQEKVVIEYPFLHTNVQELRKEEKGISLHPNPTYDVVNIKVDADNNATKAQYSIFNAAGETVKSGIINNKVFENQIDMSAQQNGFYIIRIIVDDKTYTKVFIKK